MMQAARLKFGRGRSYFYVDVAEAETVQQRRDGGARVFAGGVENSVAKGSLLELLLRLGARVSVSRFGKSAGTSTPVRAHVDAGVLVIDARDEKLQRRAG